MAKAEIDLNKAQKLVRMVETLQARGGVTVPELQERFGLDDRTLRRYISDLRELDVPVEAEGRGIHRRVWVDPRYGRRGVQLSLLEMVSLRFGRSLFEFLRGTGFTEDMDEALDTLSTLASTGSVDLSKDLDRKFMAVPEHRKDHTRDAELIEEILSALLYQNPALAHYARVAGPTRRYLLHPLTLATFRQGLYLFAYDVESGRIKSYAVERFRNFSRNRGEHFTYPADYDPHAEVRDAFGIMSGPVENVRLTFNRRASPYIRERIWHHSQEISATEDGGVQLQMRVGVAHELVSWLMGFGPDVRIDSPASLADRVRRLHREAAEGFAEMSSRRSR